MNHSDIPTRPANCDPVFRDCKWPEGKKSCLFLSFDFDGETAWLDENPNNWRNEVTLSHGGYGARVGVDKILELLKQIGVSATFFVPAWVAESHTNKCERILNAGHEIGHHGTFHLKPDFNEQEASFQEIDRGFEILDRVLGVQPIGYRAPLGENCGLYLEHLMNKGIRYFSSWRDDVFPYRHVLGNGKAGPMELPANYFFDDWMHGMIKGSSRNLVPREQVLAMWSDELLETHEWGGLTTTIFHPQVSGRPSRFRILREFMEIALDIDDLWISNGQKIYRHLIAQLPEP